jgi:hypothetical protein
MPRLAALLMAGTLGLGSVAGTASPTWTIEPSPSPGHGVYNALFSSVSALSPTDAWAVGFDTASGPSRTLAAHWDGVAWRPVSTVDPPGVDNELIGVSALASNDVWAVGDTKDDAHDVTLTLAEHWDGRQWSIVPTPNVSTAFSRSNVLTSVVAIAAKDVWVAGYAITKDGAGISLLFEHWDGTAWRIARSPSPFGTFQFANAISAVATDDVWAVGYDYSTATMRNISAHWNGRRWSLVPTPNLMDGSPPDNKLESVTAISHGDVWAVGFENNIGGSNAQRTITMRWDGGAWSLVPTPNPGAAGSELFGVTALSDHDVWAVGESRTRRGDQESLTMQWDGGAWTVFDSPNNEITTTPLSVDGVDDGVGGATVWAVGGTELPGECCLRTLVLKTTDG